MPIRDIPLTIQGYAVKPGAGAARVRSLDRRERMLRAGRALAVAWGAALACAFIPVAHFVLVPGFGIAGIVVFAVRLRAGTIPEDVRGRCPDCEVEQAFDPPTRWAVPLELSCGQCGRRLTARPATLAPRAGLD